MIGPSQSTLANSSNKDTNPRSRRQAVPSGLFRSCRSGDLDDDNSISLSTPSRTSKPAAAQIPSYAFTQSGRTAGYPYAGVGADVTEKMDRLYVHDNDSENSQDGYDSDFKDDEKRSFTSAGRSDYGSRSREISIPEAAKWMSKELENSQTQLAHAALSANSVATVLASRSTTIRDQHIFNIRIPKELGPATNQRQSGRCWLFATTNLLRLKVAEKYKIDTFQLSQSYLFYWDKLEKANFFLEIAIDTADDALSDRFVQTHFSDPVADGGQWDMAVNLVQKYGIVPHTLYPDSFSATASRELNSLLSTKLRRDAIKLRALAQKHKAAQRDGSDPSVVALAASALSASKDNTLRAVQRMITIMLGPAPIPTEEFTWEFYDSDKKFVSITTTPRDLAAQVTKPSDKANAGTRLSQMFSLVNDPRHKYNSLLTVDRLNNVFGKTANPVRYVNVEISILKRACIRMLRAGLPIFFGSDAGKFSNTKSGAWDTDMYDYENAFNVKLDMVKADRLASGESQMTHAMVITGVHVVCAKTGATIANPDLVANESDERAVRWRIENSWSDTVGDHGYFLMSDDWMDQFVYQAVVDGEFVDREVREVLGQVPTILPRWDPMGSLA